MSPHLGLYPRYSRSICRPRSPSPCRKCSRLSSLEIRGYPAISSDLVLNVLRGLSMAHIIMIHGSWSGGWMWDQVVPILTAAGHRGEAPTLLGADPGGADFPSQPISAWADQIAARARAAESPVVLVAQSRGGLVISE